VVPYDDELFPLVLDREKFQISSDSGNGIIHGFLFLGSFFKSEGNDAVRGIIRGDAYLDAITFDDLDPVLFHSS